MRLMGWGREIGFCKPSYRLCLFWLSAMCSFRGIEHVALICSRLAVGIYCQATVLGHAAAYDMAGAGGVGSSGNGINSALSASGSFIRPAFQSDAA